MATKAWFDYATYMAHKLTQMQETYPNETWTAASLKKAFEDAGFVGDEGAQRHFQKYGHTEDVSPNQYFDAEYYYKAKAIQYYGLAENGGLTKAEVEAKMDTYAKNMEGAIKAAGMDAWTHYIKYGTAEGVNPSNEFDTSDYMAAKLAALQAAEPSAGWNETSMNAAFKKAGLNALEHYMQYANKGTGEVTSTDISDFAVPASEQIEDSKTDGTTTDFTTDTDKIVGTDGNDQFNGVWAGDGSSVASSYQVGDTVTDPSTTDEDVLNLRLNTNVTSPYVAVKNVETVNLITAANQATIFDASGVNGAKKMMVDQQQGNVTTINAITSLDTAVGVNGRGGVTANFDSTLLTGSSDTVKVVFANAGTSAAASAVTVANNNTVEGVAIESTGTNYVALTGGTKAATYTVTGDGENHINLGNTGPKAVTFDASAATGGQSVTFGATQTVTATGGKGDDTFTFDATFDEKDVVDGGEGEDTLSAIISEEMAPKVSNVETFKLAFTSEGPLDGTNITGGKTVYLVNTDSDAKFVELDKSFTTLHMTDSAANDVSFAYVEDSKAELAVNVGNFDTLPDDNGNPNVRGDDQTWGDVTVSDAAKITLTSVYDEDNVKATTNTLGKVDVGNATSLAIATTASDGKAMGNLTISAATANVLVGDSLTDLSLTAAAGTDLILEDTTTAALVGDGNIKADALKNLSITVGQKGSLSFGDLVDAAKLESIKIDVADNADLVGGALDLSAGAPQGADSLKTITIKLGDGATVNDGAALGDMGGTEATINSYTLEVGKLSGNPVDLGKVTAATLKKADITLDSQSSDTNHLQVAFSIADELKGMNVTVGNKGNVDLTLDQDGASANGATFGTVTLKGEGNVTATSATPFANSTATFDASTFEGALSLYAAIGTAPAAGGTANTVNVGKGGATINLTDNTGAAANLVADTIVFKSGVKGNDDLHVTYFESGTDKLDFKALGTFAADLAAAKVAGNDVSGLIFNVAAENTLTNLVIGANGKAIAAVGANDRSEDLKLMYIEDTNGSTTIEATEIQVIGYLDDGQIANADVAV